MKLIIKNDSKETVKNPNVKIIETTEASFTNQTVFIEENDVPIIKYTDTEAMYFVKDLDNLYDRKSKSEVLLNITIDNLELIGGGNSEPVDPRPYKVYTALLNQSGTNDPAATVLENTLGYDIVWSRLNAGGYIATATEFAIEDVNKFYCNIGNRLPSGASTDIASYIVEASNLPVGSPSSFEVYTKTILNSTGVVTRRDNILEFTPIEIRVYN